MEGMNLLHSIISNPVHRRRPFRASRTLARTATAPPFLALLTAAALADWLVTRTATRLAIFIPKTPEMIAGYQWLNWIGQFGSTLGALTALAGLSWIVAKSGVHSGRPGSLRQSQLRRAQHRLFGRSARRMAAWLPPIDAHRLVRPWRALLATCSTADRAVCGVSSGTGDDVGRAAPGQSSTLRL